MKLKFCFYVFFVQLLKWTPTESVKTIDLRYYYGKQGEITKPVCVSDSNNTAYEGEEVRIYLRKTENIHFAECNLEWPTEIRNVSHLFENKEGYTFYQTTLNHLINGSYNCSFFILQNKRTQIEPTVTFNDKVYIHVKCFFNITIIKENPMLLTVNVNGENLRPTINSIHNIMKAEYKYIVGKPLSVVCSKDKSIRGNVELVQSSVPQSIEFYLPIRKAEIDLNYPQALGNFFTLTCYLHDHENVNIIKETYIIDFSQKGYNNGNTKEVKSSDSSKEVSIGTKNVGNPQQTVIIPSTEIPLSTTSPKSSISQYSSDSSIWMIVTPIILVALIVVAVCFICVNRKRKTTSIASRPPQPIPETQEMDILNTISISQQNLNEPVYEEIRDDLSPPRELRRLHGLQLDRQTGMLIVNGKRIDLQKLLEETK